MKYIVSTALATGKSDPKFGTEYHVKLENEPATFTMWFKNEPTPGQELNGEISQSQYGPKFTKEKKEWNPTAQPSGATQGVSSAKSAPKAAPYKKVDNSDGMRQGMCINNAAAFVLQNGEPAVEPQQWAKAVYDYACALYTLGDLKVVPPTQEEMSVREIFAA